MHMSAWCVYKMILLFYLPRLLHDIVYCVYKHIPVH